MMAGLCESSLTFQAISIWRDELYAGKVLLRDIIDLDATITDRGPKPTPVAVSDIERRPTSDYLPVQPDRPPQMPVSPLSAVRSANQLAIERQQATRLSARATSTKTTCRSGFRSALWRWSSNRRCSRPSIASRITSSGSAAWKNSTFRVS